MEIDGNMRGDEVHAIPFTGVCIMALKNIQNGK
jgi:hypothetical protein